MTVSHTEITERIARVLAARRLSSNAEGCEPHAAGAVDGAWGDYLDDAQAILRAIREPDEAMADIGDAAVWSAMVRTALGEAFDHRVVGRLSDPADAPEIYQKPLG